MNQIIDILFGAAFLVPHGDRRLRRPDLYGFQSPVRVAAAGVSLLAAAIQLGTALRLSFSDLKSRKQA